MKANSVTTSVSMSCREEEDLNSTADLKGVMHTVHSHSDNVSVRTGSRTGDLGPEQAVRLM